MTAELLSILIAIFFFICILFVIAVIITEIPKFLIGVFVSFILTIVCLCMMLLNKEVPSKRYQEKVGEIK